MEERKGGKEDGKKQAGEERIDGKQCKRERTKGRLER